MSQTDYLTGAWRRFSRIASGLSPGARLRLALAAGPLACLWAMEATPARFDQVPLASGLLVIIVFACAHDVIAAGLHDLLVSARLTHEALAATAAWIGFSASFLFAALHARGRLPAGLQDSSGEPLLFFAPAGTIIALRLLSRETLERLLPQGLATMDGSHSSRREIEIARRASAALRACAVAAVGTLIPAAILTRGASAAPACMAAIAGLSPELVGVVLALTRSRAAALLPEENPERSLEGLEACSKVNAVIFQRGGVITAERPEVTQVHTLRADWSREDVIHLAAVAEYATHHPIRDAILKICKADLRTVPSLKNCQTFPGRGIRALYQGKDLCLGNLRLFEEGNWSPQALQEIESRTREWSTRGETVLFLSLGPEIVGALCLQDPLRHGCGETFEALAELGVRAIVLSGDPHPSLAGLPAHADVEIQGGVLAEQRPSALEKLKEEGLVVGVAGTRSFLSSWGSSADFCFLWPEGARGAPKAPHLEVPGRSFSLTRKNLVDIPERIAHGRSLVRLRMRAFRLAALYLLVAVPLLAGALGPWTGLGPSPTLAALASTLLPAGALLLFRGASRARI